ncbi:hypothetical protein DFJ43DRAFT_226642 [Lentinula guzmanii]|uniref:Uncharacterized protein n=1 Tax=Lentinula guzmanii TaxID=2804957 RepID=A0AA38JNM2_9AGAR|nr:hypothetical protein DFJ43DRAFT_226642 [Lentinula guzmanii]
MPRILPRLLKKLEETSSQKAFDHFSLDKYRFRGKSFWKPPPPNPLPSFKPSDYSQSILLTPNNPITSSRDYIRRKSLPPRANLPENAQRRKNDLFDRPRRMTDEERGWWASPYLRMLSTPLRRCLQTQQLLPSAFLVRLGVFRAPSSNPSRFFSPNSPPEAVLLPDGLEHPKFRGRRSGKGGYVLCWKDALEHSRVSGSYKRIAFNSRLPSVLDQIRHLLRLRVLQELQLVIDALRFRPRKLVDRDKPLIRRLTRVEWHHLKTTGIMPVTVTENAMAVIVLPPLNRHPVTKERPTGVMSSLPPAQDSGDPSGAEPQKFQKPALPLCTLHPTGLIDLNLIENGENSPQISKAETLSQIPLYNGVTLFPDPSQRAVLLNLLCRVLAIERNARAKSPIRVADTAVPEDLTPSSISASSSSLPTPSSASPSYNSTSYDSRSPSSSMKDAKNTEDNDNRASHAFLLYSDAHTALSADMAGVGLALWRIPMFEGMGWDKKINTKKDEADMAHKGLDEGSHDIDSRTEFSGSSWIKRYKYRSMFGDERYRVKV